MKDTPWGLLHPKDEAKPLSLKHAAPVGSALHRTAAAACFSTAGVHEGQHQQKHTVVFYVFFFFFLDSKAEQLSGEVLSISSERIFKDGQAWRGGSLLMTSRKSGGTGDSRGGEECPRLACLTGFTLNEQGGSGCSWKWNFRAESNKCRGLSERSCRALIARRIWDDFNQRRKKCIDVFRRLDSYCCVVRFSNGVNNSPDEGQMKNFSIKNLKVVQISAQPDKRWIHPGPVGVNVAVSPQEITVYAGFFGCFSDQESAASLHDFTTINQFIKVKTGQWKHQIVW